MILSLNVCIAALLLLILSQGAHGAGIAEAAGVTGPATIQLLLPSLPPILVDGGISLRAPQNVSVSGTMNPITGTLQINTTLTMPPSTIAALSVSVPTAWYGCKMIAVGLYKACFAPVGQPMEAEIPKKTRCNGIMYAVAGATIMASSASSAFLFLRS